MQGAALYLPLSRGPSTNLAADTRSASLVCGAMGDRIRRSVVRLIVIRHRWLRSMITPGPPASARARATAVLQLLATRPRRKSNDDDDDDDDEE